MHAHTSFIGPWPYHGVARLVVVHILSQSTLAEAGGGEAPRGGKASPSVLPTSTLSCDSGGYPLSLLEVHLPGATLSRATAPGELAYCIPFVIH